MRLGVSTGFNATSAEDWAAKQVELGCKAAVFPLNCEVDTATIDAYAKAAKDNDIKIAEVGVWRNTLAADPAERKAVIDYSIRQLELAERIGAACCVNVVGTACGPRWDGGYAGNFSAETRKEIVSMVREIIDAVNPRNTKYSIEPMPWMVPTGPDDYLRLIDEVDREGFGVHLDFINMINCPERYFFMNEFMDETFEKLGKRIVSCHIKDIKLLPEFTFQLRECECGTGVMELPRYLAHADRISPDMPVLIEHLDSDEDYIRSFRFVNEIAYK